MSTTRSARYWRSFLRDLLSSPAATKTETMYDGVCFFTPSGHVEYREGCFHPSSSSVTLDVHPQEILAIFDQIKRQAILDEANAQQSAKSRQNPPVNVTPAVRLGDLTLYVVSATFTSICAVASGKSRGLVVEQLPFGVLVVTFTAPMELETAFSHIDNNLLSFSFSTMYFCAACNVYVKDSSVAEHDRTTAHLLSSSKGVSVKKVWLPESNRGYQILRTMGWEEDRGLGPTGDGKMAPITTTFKRDRAGLGLQATAKLARVTHFPRHDEEQAKMAADGRSDAQRTQDRLSRKRKQQQRPVMLSKTQRKVQKQVEQNRNCAIGNELYSEGLEGYEEFLR
ncbi:G patch domain and ankyrin repeat-containing protein 1 [Phytophthora boehmeriae]|uniref:G patch domain and ankyrin repeat-containing protein 1 n=1 Tax=Phytophthora boehmeriae TaxID=109152 RepID=A0A8T1WUT6_9STRA|nr:G patch domain and ankyrin repeat-containing protein 1 [Phytophthora boehmeriae]